MKALSSAKNYNKLIQGTFLLTIAGFITRIIGFIYRIFLSDVLGASLLGIYQLVFPVYGICFTIYGAGIQTAISQLIAAHSGSSGHNPKGDYHILRCGIGMSLLLSVSLSVSVFFGADLIAGKFLLEPACAPYLKLLCLLFPPCGITACINGYFYGKKEAGVPAVTQIVEQLIRVASVVALCMSLSASGEAGCRFAVMGLFFGETASCLYNIIKLIQKIHATSGIQGNSRLSFPRPYRREQKTMQALVFLAFTLTTTKLVVSLLHSVESVFIPAALKDFGCTAAEALGIYGILSGIAMPFILFPSTITNSFAVMLLPAIAEAQAEKREEKISRYVTISSKYSLLIGYLFTCIFLLFGKEFGTWLFHSPTAGSYIYLLSWICPFLYLSTTLTSIINGLGQTQLTFFITIACLSVKIYFLIALVPRYGIQAYLIGILLSHIIMTLLEWFYLRKYLLLSPKCFLAVPGITLAAAGLAGRSLFAALPIPQTALSITCAMAAICLAICGIYILVLGRSGCISRKDF